MASKITEAYCAVLGLYPNSAGWRYKVNRMPSSQVLGIYYDRIVNAKQKLMANNLKKNSRVEHIWRDNNERTQYHCTACGATYRRDNPDLTHCEFCNSKIEEENILQC